MRWAWARRCKPSHLREAYGIRGKHLIVVPLSTLENWMREFSAWSPVFQCLKLFGTKTERTVLCAELLAFDTFDVCVTTFEACHAERRTLSKIQYVPCHAVSCRAVPCRAVPCRAVLCRAILTPPSSPCMVSTS